MLKVRSDLLRFKNVFSQIVYRIYVPVDKSLKSRGISFQSVIHVIRALLRFYSIKEYIEVLVVSFSSENVG